MIRVSGPGAAAVAARVFRGPAVASWIPRHQHFGRLIDAEEEPIDEVLLTFFPGPHSFTGEDTVEIACHGGTLVTGRILEVLCDAGAMPARPGEFSERAFLNGKLDLTQAEAIMDLISARTDLALKAAAEQLEGRLGREINAIRSDLLGVVAHLEAYIDFPEEEIDPDSSGVLLEKTAHILARIDALLATADQGRILREGIRTVICGPPNAGKSSLLNRLLGYDRAIVSDTAGTTRDTLEEYVNLKGIPLRLIDTAGLRAGAGSLEQEGIERARVQIAAADLILHVVDASRGADGFEPIVAPAGARSVIVLNKADLPRHPDWDASQGIAVCCLDERSVDSFRQQLYSLVTSGTGLATADLVSINTRHQQCLKRARRALEAARGLLAAGEAPEFVAVDLRSSLDAIGEVVGKADTEEILGEIFGRFCIGK